jgi:hypothetical protein
VGGIVIEVETELELELELEFEIEIENENENEIENRNLFRWLLQGDRNFNPVQMRLYLSNIFNENNRLQKGEGGGRNSFDKKTVCDRRREGVLLFCL